MKYESQDLNGEKSKSKGKTQKSKVKAARPFTFAF